MDDHNKNSKSTDKTPAQIADNLIQKTAAGLFLLAASYALSAAIIVSSEESGSYLENVKLALRLIVLVIVFPAFFSFIRMRISRKEYCQESEGYIAEMFKQACVYGFSFTFISLLILKFLVPLYGNDLPADFFINIIMALSLGVFSITFYLLIRDDDDDLVEDDFEGGDA